jgi:hypothetical protein
MQTNKEKSFFITSPSKYRTLATGAWVHRDMHVSSMKTEPVPKKRWTKVGL